MRSTVQLDAGPVGVGSALGDGDGRTSPVRRSSTSVPMLVTSCASRCPATSGPAAHTSGTSASVRSAGTLYVNVISSEPPLVATVEWFVTSGLFASDTAAAT